MSAEQRIGGRCFCGAIRFHFVGVPNWIVHCHCESCRRATSSPMTTFVSVQRSALQFTIGMPRYLASSAEVKRGFCETCGSQLSHEHEQLPDEVHLYATSSDDPTNPIIEPSRHVFVSEQLSWFEVHDELPRYATTSQGDAKPLRIGPSA